MMLALRIIPSLPRYVSRKLGVNQHHNFTWIQVILVSLPFLSDLKDRKVDSNISRPELIRQDLTMVPSSVAKEFSGTVDWLGKRGIRLPHQQHIWCNWMKVSKVRGNTSIMFVCRTVWVVVRFPSTTRGGHFYWLYLSLPASTKMWGRWRIELEVDLCMSKSGVVAWNAFHSSVSPALKLVPQSEINSKVLPLREVTLLKAIKNVSASILSSSSRWIQHVVKHLKRIPHYFSLRRTIFNSERPEAVHAWRREEGLKQLQAGWS